MGTKIIYKVVRTYTYGDGASKLNDCFEQGWQYKACHQIDDETLEYILYKEVEIDESNVN